MKNLFSYLKNRPIYLLLGKYHKVKMSRVTSIFGTSIINYGIDDIFTNTKLIDSLDNNLSIFPSRIDRNLDLLIDIWKNYVNKYNKSSLDNIDYAFLGAWNFKDEIFKKEKKFLKKGGKFITHVPFPKII